jgi:hypothetical protein
MVWMALALALAPVLLAQAVAKPHHRDSEYAITMQYRRIKLHSTSIFDKSCYAAVCSAEQSINNRLPLPGF